MDKNNKIAYVIIVYSYQAGVTNKLVRYAKISEKKSIPIDFIWLTHSRLKEKLKGIEKIRIEYPDTENSFLTRKWQAKRINELQADYKKIIIRYPLYDPILGLFLKNRKNIITEHHTKEIDEYKLKGSKRYLLEKWFGSKWLRDFGGIIGVTDEIRKYELTRSKSKSPSIFIPNSIPVDNVNMEHCTDEIFQLSKLNITIVANFRPWHGLNVIIKGIEKYKELSDKYILHLVGKIPDEFLDILKNYPQVKIHGFKTSAELSEIYKYTDIGLSGFNLEVKNMKEATTLKVREYYANGIPVAFGHLDTAFPKDFKYKYYSKEFDIQGILNFAEKIKGTPKHTIFEAAKPYISSEVMLEKMYNFAFNI